MIINSLYPSFIKFGKGLTNQLCLKNFHYRLNLHVDQASNVRIKDGYVSLQGQTVPDSTKLKLHDMKKYCKTI